MAPHTEAQNRKVPDLSATRAEATSLPSFSFQFRVTLCSCASQDPAWRSRRNGCRPGETSLSKLSETLPVGHESHKQIYPATGLLSASTPALSCRSRLFSPTLRPSHQSNNCSSKREEWTLMVSHPRKLSLSRQPRTITLITVSLLALSYSALLLTASTRLFEPPRQSK